MISFNSFMIEAGIEPHSVQLIRHQGRWKTDITPYSLWRTDPVSFEAYQKVQGREVFKTGGSLASFVADPAGDTLFVGMYSVAGRQRSVGGEHDPSRKSPLGPDQAWVYHLSSDPRLADLRGRLVIDWGPGLRSWIQRADSQPKSILELRRTIEEPQFPGFDLVQVRSDCLTGVYRTWAEVLKSARGVYLLVCCDTGEQYVGAAYGAGGFWQRWTAYAANGHGGNLKLKQRGLHVYEMSVLQTVGSDASAEQIVQLESRWKKKLGSRAHGLNAY